MGESPTLGKFGGKILVGRGKGGEREGRGKKRKGKREARKKGREGGNLKWKGKRYENDQRTFFFLLVTF